MIETNFGPMPIVYENSDIIVVNKPHGLHSIDDREQLQTQTVRSLLDARYGKIYILHRLDAGTGGLLICAKTAAKHRELSLEFEAGRVYKEYYALVDGKFANAITLLLPIQSKASKGKYKVNFKSGKTAITSFIPISEHGDKTLVKAIPYTGRTHQIRVHLKVLKHPLYQDWVYNKATADRRLTLFAKKLSLAGYEFEVDLSDFMQTKL